MTLKKIFTRFKWKILGTFSLLSLENVLTVSLPFFLGLAINDLLDKSFRGLIYFVAADILRLIIGTARRVYDTRVYTTIYTVVASETVENHRQKKVGKSATITRANLVRELIDFFERDLTMGFSSLVSVLGAMVMLAIFDLWLLLGCFVALVLILIIYAFSEKRIFNLNRNYNDELENQVDIISDKPKLMVLRHFRKLARFTVKLSDLESINFGLSELVLFALAIVALIISVNGPNVTPGGIFSILSYILEFAEGIFLLPIIYQQVIRLKEISGRLNITDNNN